MKRTLYIDTYMTNNSLNEIGAWSAILTESDEVNIRETHRTGTLWGATSTRLVLTAMSEMLPLVPEGERVVVMTDNRQVLAFFARSEGWGGVDYLAPNPKRNDGDYWMKMTASKRYRRVMVTQYSIHGNTKYPDNFVTAMELAKRGIIPMEPGDKELVEQMEFEIFGGVPKPHKK